jgi:ABC-type nitrate/sulfonate/bicarbonate transport system substrate-binding protein
MTRSRLLIPAVVLVAAISLLAACGGDDEEVTTPTPGSNEPPERITFMAGFKPQANLPFVGVYVAQEQGFFAEENLEVEIQHVATPGENFRFLALDEVQITTADATALLERRTGDPELPFVSIALIGQRGQQGFAVLEDSGIETPEDWAGKRAGYKGVQVTPDYLAILEANGVERSAVGEVRVGFEPQILTEGQVDVFPVFLSNEPNILRNLGYDVRVFEAADYGAPTLGLTYIATEEFIEGNPDVIARFLWAALRGIDYADDNPEEALEIVMQYAPQEDREHQRFMLDTELAAAFVDEAEHRPGWQTLEQWQELHDFLVRFDALEAPVDDISAVFTDRFVREIYGAAQGQY